MNFTDLLQELRRQGISLLREGESLKIQAPKGALTAELRAALATHKTALLEWLKQTTVQDGAALPQCQPNEAELGQPFPLADLQLGFYMADDPYMEFHVRPHYYIEKNVVDLDLQRYEAAWNKALQRHRREIVKVRPEGDLITVTDFSPLQVQVMDLRGHPSSDVVRALEATRETMQRSELPLDRWPWVDLRVSLWREGGKNHARIHYNHNNFFSDGYGTMRLLKEVDRYYEQPDLLLPALTLSFRDAVTTLEELARSPEGVTARRYWEERLPNLPGPPELPVRPGMDRRCRSRLHRRERFIDAAIWRSFKDNARSFGVTPSNAVFAAYAEIVAAWSNSRHFVLSNMMTRRLAIHPEIREIIGNFASLYPLEIDFRPGGSFADRARRIQEQVIRDSQHLRWGGMQVMQAFNRQSGGFGRAPIPFVIGSGLFMEGFERSDYSCLETSQVMLDHQFWELADGRYYYVWDLLEEFFPAGMIDAMGEAYASLIEHLAADVEHWKKKLFFVTPRQQLDVRQAVCPPAVAPSALRLDDFLRAASGKYSSHAAVWSPCGSLNYGELNQSSDALAAALRRSGVQRGHTVAVVADRGPALVRAVYGILKAGAAYVPIAPSLPEERRTYLLKNSEAQHVVTEPGYAADLSWPAEISVHVGSGGLGRDDDTEGEPGAVTDPAYIIYTSGSTGQPKGVMIDHRGAVNTILDVNEKYRVGSKDVIFGVSSCGFDLSVYDLFGSIQAGATLVYPDPEHALNPAHWLDLMVEKGVTVWNSAPPLATLLVESAEFRRIQLPDLRLVMLSGDWIPVDLPARLRAIAPQAEVVSLGGATEASIWSIWYDVGAVDPAWPSIPYGYPMRNQSWFVLDEWGRPSPEWVPGELFIGGIGLALGYWNDPQKTDASFIRHPDTGERIYRTGDLGRYLPGGVIEFLGRKDFQVKIQGHRIELGEIETVLNACPGVSAAVVVVQKSETGTGPQLAAHVVLAAGASLTVETIREFLGRKLPEYMVPRLVAFLDRLPLSSNGKLDRKALPRIGEMATGVTAKAKRPAKNPIEAQLLEIWRKVLKRDGLSAVDDFFEVGGQSFEAVRIVGLIRETFGVSLSLGDIWQSRTIEQLARCLQAGDKAGPTRCLVEIQRDGEGSPLFLVHPAGGHVLCYRELASRVSRPVFAFQAPGVDGRGEPLTAISDFARTYLEILDEVQPDGPVLLGGWSSGAPIAYEMAAQLLARGRTVEGVLVIDSPAPLVHDLVSGRVLFDWFLGDLNLNPNVYQELVRLDAIGMTDEEQFAQAAALMRERGVELGEDIEQLRAIYRVFKGMVHGSRRYWPDTAEVNMLVVRARDGVVSEFSQHPFAERSDWGWREFATGQVDTAWAEGTHYTLLSTPSVATVAAAVEDWLGQLKEQTRTSNSVGVA